MAKAIPLDNPARRLYALLEAYLEAHPQRSPSGNSAAWTDALGSTSKHEFLVLFSRAFSLVADVHDALLELNDPIPLEAYKLHSPAWRTAFFPDSFGWGQGITGPPQVDRAAMVALAQIGSQLAAERVASAKELEPSTVEELLSEAMALVDAADDLPDEMTALLVRRLNDAVWALRHYKVSGSVGLEEALDRLAVAIARSQQAVPEESREWFAGVTEFAKKAYDAVAVPGTLYGTYAAISAVIPNVPGIGS